MQKNEDELFLKNIQINSQSEEIKKLKKELQNMKEMYDTQQHDNSLLQETISRLQVSNDGYLKERNVILFL